jgi:hypothetical protein
MAYCYTIYGLTGLYDMSTLLTILGIIICSYIVDAFTHP